MSISILKWIDVVGKKRLADIELCKSEMQAFVYVGNIDTQDLWKNKNIELDYESLVQVIPLRGLSDRRTTVKKIDDGYAIWGKVVNLIELESGRICVDLYISNGPEFITLDISSDQSRGIRPKSFVYAEVTGLCCFPTNL